MSKANTLKVEYFRCWDSHTWDTDFLELSGDLDPDDYGAIQQAIEEAASKIEWRDDHPCFVGLYAIDQDAEEFEEEQS